MSVKLESAPFPVSRIQIELLLKGGKAGGSLTVFEVESIGVLVEGLKKILEERGEKMENLSFIYGGKKLSSPRVASRLIRDIISKSDRSRGRMKILGVGSSRTFAEKVEDSLACRCARRANGCGRQVLHVIKTL